MTPQIIRRSWLLAPLMLLALCTSRASAAASSGVHDEAHFFSDDTVQQAEQIIRQIDQKHRRDVLVETVPSVPSDLQDRLQQQGTRPFFQSWANQRAKQRGVSGIYILICRQPSHLEVAVGNATAQRLFTIADRDAVAKQLVSAFKERQYDQGLIAALQSIQQRMDENAGSSRSAVSSPGPSSGVPIPRPPPRTGFGIGGLACVLIAVVLLIVLIRGMFGRSGSSYGGYYPPQGGAYPPGAYPPPGGYGYGGGGGFGRGFLGGLLGGALGGYAAEKWAERGQSGGYAPPPTADSGGYSPGVDTSFSSGGGDFGSGADSGGGGGDFGGGGGDFGGGGGDFGGGGGGGDTGGGGDF